MSAQPSLPAPRADKAKTKAFDASRMLRILCFQSKQIPKAYSIGILLRYAICFDALLLLNVGESVVKDESRLLEEDSYVESQDR